jgi:uncharacterized protein (TIGR02117 family)
MCVTSNRTTAMAPIPATRALLLGLLLLTAGALAPAAAERTIWVTSNGWHTGIVIARADLPAGAIPETADFPAAAYFDFGWGDMEYYPAPRKTLGMTLGAALPGPAVVHLTGLPGHPSRFFPSNETIALRLSEHGFRRLVAYLAATFERRGGARAAPNARGLYPYSSFYPATGQFHLFNTCNTWTARGLAAAGLAVRASGVQRAEELMVQVRALARAAARPPGD